MRHRDILRRAAVKAERLPHSAWHIGTAVQRAGIAAHTVIDVVLRPPQGDIGIIRLYNPEQRRGRQGNGFAWRVQIVRGNQQPAVFKSAVGGGGK